MQHEFEDEVGRDDINERALDGNYSMGMHRQELFRSSVTYSTDLEPILDYSLAYRVWD